MVHPCDKGKYVNPSYEFLTVVMREFVHSIFAKFELISTILQVPSYEHFGTSDILYAKESLP